jgi:nitrogen regulatory protein PII
MKKIECFVRPYNFGQGAEALAVEGVMGMTVYEVEGFGAQGRFRGRDHGRDPTDAAARRP